MSNPTQPDKQRQGLPQSPLFDLGRVVATAAVSHQLASDYRSWMADCLTHHHHGNWGQVDDHDRDANNAAVTNGSRILSVYPTPKGIEADADVVWVITDAAVDDNGRRLTTAFLYPHEY